jgi:lambda repressor-like predicted transcriptional regulator
MAPSITKIRSLPPSAQLTAQRMGLTGFPEGTWSFNMNHDLADMGKVMQVRDLKEAARKSRVNDYATAMKPYTTDRTQLTFPPLIFSADGWLIDGNHRNLAAVQLGWLTFPAFTISFSYQNQATAILDQFLELAALCNVSHGDNLDRENVAKIIERLAKDDSSAADLGKRLGIPRSTVQNVLWARTARLRAERLDVPCEADHVFRTHLAEIGRLDKTFTDDVFAALVNLTVKGKLRTGEQKAVIQQVESQTTTQGKLDLIEAEMSGRDGIVSNRATKPSPAAQLRQALGKVNAGDLGMKLEKDPKHWDTHKRQLREGIANMEKILGLQHQMEDDFRRNQKA